MATIVKYKPNGKKYVFLGVGFGAYGAVPQPGFLGKLGPSDQERHITMVAVSDSQGVIRWAQSDEIEVVEVDGRQPRSILPMG